MNDNIPKDPISNVQWVDIDKVEANNYNPNVVASNELYLLHLSIQNDGYTQPIVTVYDKERDKYVIVDGFHRYLVMLYHKDIRERYRTHGKHRKAQQGKRKAQYWGNGQSRIFDAR